MLKNEATDFAETDDEILRVAKERFDLAVEAENEFRTQALEDLKFRVGEQWPEEVRREREADRRPCLTINKIPQHVKQVTNDQRQNKSSIKIHPIDDKADIETAKIFQGIIRHIESDSNADVAYNTSFDSSVTCGRGFFRILTDFCDPMSFDIEAKFKRVRNPFSVYMDPNSQELDGSDMEWCFVFEDMSEDSYNNLFKDSKLSNMDDWAGIGDQAKNWFNGKQVRIAEYFYKTYEDADIVLLSNKEVLLKSDLPEILPLGIKVIAERRTKLPKVNWCKINGVEILEKTEWPGRWIPVIPVYGDEIDVEGKLILEGIIRHAKDPQRMYNYWASSETETIALAPRAPYIGAEGQFEGHEDQWESANRRNHAFLQYKPTTISGQLAPPPQRNVYEPAVSAITQARGLAAEDLKSTTGIYDASLGNRSNESSGIAIQRRNNQSQTSNFHFVDNLTISKRHAGRILVDVIPKIYDTARAARIIGEEGEQEIVRINEEFERNGKKVTYNLGVGKYDVAVDTGPSFATRRQEAATSMLEMSKANPQITQLAGDLMVKNMDWPGKDEVAERLKKALPPGIAEDDKDQKKMPIPPQVKAQMDQMGQLIDQLTQKLNEANDNIEKKTIELESKERIEFAKIQANIEIEMAKLGSQEAQTLLMQEIAGIKQRMELLHINEPIEHDHENLNGGAGFEEGFGVPSEQQPTDGISSGQPMGV